MGCDIHLYAEKRVDGKWVSADVWETDPDVEGRLWVPYDKAVYHERNYGLFALLAGVRNYERVPPVCEPRGLPDDACDRVKSECEAWGCDGHSHTWLTLAELLAFDWTQTAIRHGIVDAPECEEWLRRRQYNPEPHRWCRGVAGPNVQIIPFDQMQQRLDALRDASKDKEGYVDYETFQEKITGELGSTFCEVEWQIPYARDAARFWWEAIPKLLRLGKPEDVRIVFWFDN